MARLNFDVISVYYTARLSDGVNSAIFPRVQDRYAQAARVDFDQIPNAGRIQYRAAAKSPARLPLATRGAFGSYAGIFRRGMATARATSFCAKRGGAARAGNL